MKLLMDPYLNQAKQTNSEGSSANNTQTTNIYQKSIYQKPVNENPIDNRRMNYQKPTSLDDLSKGFGDF